MKIHHILITAFFVILSGIFILLVHRQTKEDNTKYRIQSGNNKIYYANTFRMYGRGITFETIDGNQVILTGNIDIEYIKK